MSEQLFYVQDSRNFVGNDVLWRAKDGSGYTTDISKAEVYSLNDAQRIHNNRSSDVPWPKNYIDGKTRPIVDREYIKREEALAGTGISLKHATVEVMTWFRESTNEWIGEIEYRAGKTTGTARYTGTTENEARNAAFAAVGYNLLSATFEA